jgi:hypothetical protein
MNDIKRRLRVRKFSLRRMNANDSRMLFLHLGVQATQPGVELVEAGMSAGALVADASTNRPIPRG